MKLGWGLAGLCLCGLVIVPAVVPWTLRGAARRGEIAAAMSRNMALDVRIGGPITLKLLPRPRLHIADVGVRSTDHSIDLSAPALSGELDLAAWLHGEWRLASATLSNPTATFDLDAAERPPQPDERSDPSPFRFRLAVRGGVFRLVSRHLPTDTIVTDVSAAATGQGGRESRFSATGSAIWRGMAAQFTLETGAPQGPAEDRVSSAFLQINSPIASVSATGDLSGSGTSRQFAGRLFASTTAPLRMMPTLGFGPSWMNLERASLSGDVVAKFGDVSVSGATLRLNTSSFDGTLGYRTDKGRGLIEGTLATGQVDVAGLVGRNIDPRSLSEFYRARLAPHLAETNLDLRVSAASMDFGTMSAQDVALSLLSRDRHLEVTLDEAQAFGGIVKARLLASVLRDRLEAHADMTVSGLDLGVLGAAITGRERMTGTLEGTIALDGQGESLSDIVPTLAGTGDLSVVNGNFLGLSVSQALKRFTRRLPFGADRPGQVTAFATASSKMRIAKGIVDFIDGKASGPGMVMALGGLGDLPRGKVDILAVVSPTDAAGAIVADAPHLPIEMLGSWGQPLQLMERTHRLPLSGLNLPDLGPVEALP